jgi:hypothetical protein
MSQPHGENLAEDLFVFRDSCHVYAVRGRKGRFWSMQETAGDPNVRHLSSERNRCRAKWQMQMTV